VDKPIYLTLAEVIAIHSNQIDLYGGQPGMRDLGLLQSAVAQPEAGFGGQWLHEDIFAMAAAYAFHICQNHPFVDGNKRTALASALVFLEMNGISLEDPKRKLLKAMLNMTQGELSRQQFAQVLRMLR
jgi:death-on-curing protein